jgi:hypothetical protein
MNAAHEHFLMTGLLIRRFSHDLAVQAGRKSSASV